MRDAHLVLVRIARHQRDAIRDVAEHAGTCVLPMLPEVAVVRGVCVHLIRRRDVKVHERRDVAYGEDSAHAHENAFP